MDHSRLRLLTNGLDTNSGLAFLFREGELIVRAGLSLATTVNAQRFQDNAGFLLTHTLSVSPHRKTSTVAKACLHFPFAGISND